MVNHLIQKATDELRKQNFTENTIRMSYLNYWKPFAAELGDIAFDRQSADGYFSRKYGVDMPCSSLNPLNKRQRRACHAFHVLSVFHEDGIIASTSIKCKQIRQPLGVMEQQVLNRYLEWRRDEGDTERTLDNRMHAIHPFLRAIPIGKVGKKTVFSYLTEMGARLSNSSMKAKTGILKCFLSYCAQEGHLEDTFHSLFPKYRDYSGLGVPSAFTVQELLRYMKNLEVPNRRRNYAMAVLMVSYGFRVSEILNMELPDINWSDSSITVRQSKTGDPLYRRLTAAAGNLLTSYLLEERPESSCCSVFLKCDGSAIGSAATVSGIISEAFLNSGVKVAGRHHGSHSLRHSLATAMLGDGTGMFEIAGMLGHTFVDTSRIYAKVDVESLRFCELEVPCHE